VTQTADDAITFLRRWDSSRLTYLLARPIPEAPVKVYPDSAHGILIPAGRPFAAEPFLVSQLVTPGRAG
jgi:hypothetical protein